MPGLFNADRMLDLAPQSPLCLCDRLERQRKEEAVKRRSAGPLLGPISTLPSRAQTDLRPKANYHLPDVWQFRR